ncbi:MAG: prepilin-type N-terminal cleavage/methylation domain-containing protein [Candidatus Omnitrophica bacterium]|nr:prepilin-type N-terminal cleavage/methylation domain-containing protein [Candidatus Omnitrophota bacterium]
MAQSLKERGFSLFEIIIATIILALIVTGLANIFVSVKRFNLNSQLRMSGGELEKLQFSRFSDAVRQDQWDDGAKDYQAGNMLRKAPAVTEAPIILSSSPYPERQYIPTYTVEVPPSFPAVSPMRKVKVVLTWTE